METAEEWFSRAACLSADESMYMVLHTIRMLTGVGNMLTEYDLHREPLPLVPNNEERTLILRKLNQVCSIFILEVVQVAN